MTETLLLLFMIAQNYCAQSPQGFIKYKTCVNEKYNCLLSKKGKTYSAIVFEECLK